MVTGKTDSGFQFRLEDQVLDNMELVDALAEAQADDPMAVSRAVKLLLGEEQRRRLYDHLRTADGRVPVAAVTEAVAQIFRAFSQQEKN